jgi:D-2-hydroxyacid dehydrogenase (NADP+)
VLEVLVLDRDANLYSEAIAQALPETRVFAATDEAAALNGCAEAEIVVALAHMISDRLVDGMPRLRFIQALTTGTDHLATLALPPDMTIASMRGIHGLRSCT